MRLWTIEHEATAPVPKSAPVAADADALVDLAFAALTVRPSRYDMLYPEEA